MAETKLNCQVTTYYSKNMDLTNDSHVLRLSAQSPQARQQSQSMFSLLAKGRAYLRADLGAHMQ